MALDLLTTLKEGLSDEPAGPRAAGIEIRQDLEPVAGLPVLPPSYEGPLEIHDRYVDGTPRKVIELDSVGSAANRIEEALLGLYEAGDYPLPVSSTTIKSGDESIRITTLETPHRIFDAWIRLSASADDQDTDFEDSEHGRELSLAHASALDPVLETSAHDLLFGVWDSHRKGPNGQVRVGRALTTTLLGFDPIPQGRVAARRDPVNLGEASDLPKGEKRLSEQGLSSIPPQRVRGGVAITEARYVGFLSFAALRRLRFARYDPVSVRIMLACLGLYGVVTRIEAGWDLRAQCALAPQGDPAFTLVGPRGQRDTMALSADELKPLFHETVASAGVEDRSVQLHGSARLNSLVEKSIASSLKKD